MREVGASAEESDIELSAPESNRERRE